MLDRQQIFQEYNLINDNLIELLDDLSADIWKNQEKQAEETIESLKTSLGKVFELRKNLLELKTEELKNATKEDQEYLNELKEKWLDEEIVLKVLFNDADSPFIFEWPGNIENWTIGIVGLKEKLPIKSKSFINLVKDILTKAREEFNRN